MTELAPLIQLIPLGIAFLVWFFVIPFLIRQLVTAWLLYVRDGLYEVMLEKPEIADTQAYRAVEFLLCWYIHSIRDLPRHRALIRVGHFVSDYWRNVLGKTAEVSPENPIVREWETIKHKKPELVESYQDCLKALHFMVRPLTFWFWWGGPFLVLLALIFSLVYAVVTALFGWAVQILALAQRKTNETAVDGWLIERATRTAAKSGEIPEGQMLLGMGL